MAQFVLLHCFNFHIRFDLLEHVLDRWHLGWTKHIALESFGVSTIWHPNWHTKEEEKV